MENKQEPRHAIFSLFAVFLFLLFLFFLATNKETRSSEIYILLPKYYTEYYIWDVLYVSAFLYAFLNFFINNSTVPFGKMEKDGANRKFHKELRIDIFSTFINVFIKVGKLLDFLQ